MHDIEVTAGERGGDSGREPALVQASVVEDATITNSRHTAAMFPPRRATRSDHRDVVTTDAQRAGRLGHDALGAAAHLGPRVRVRDGYLHRAVG